MFRRDAGTFSWLAAVFAELSADLSSQRAWCLAVLRFRSSREAFTDFSRATNVSCFEELFERPMEPVIRERKKEDDFGPCDIDFPAGGIVFLPDDGLSFGEWAAPWGARNEPRTDGAVFPKISFGGDDGTVFTALDGGFVLPKKPRRGIVVFERRFAASAKGVTNGSKSLILSPGGSAGPSGRASEVSSSRAALFF